ncbi:ABC transporter permease [Streptosporangium sp. NPDC051022]|uniref:ABC transporter permease n=1 Tax=Streptosporangium sp. NPDC051022 TaxID=3155752 RepID=UPI00342F1E7C
MRLGPSHLAGVALVLAGWQAAGAVRPDFTSSPTLVAAELLRLARDGDLLSLVAGTVVTLLTGWATAALLGVSAGVLIGRHRLLAVALEPYLVALYSVPLIALVPLMIIWFGIGQGFLLATIVLATAIMLVFPAATGTRESVRAYGELARAYQVTGRRFLFKVVLPGALPYIAAGLRISVQRALMAVVVGQFLVGHPGLGTLLGDARARLDADEVFAVALVALAVGALLTALVGWAGRRLSAWRPEVTT